MSIPAKGPPRPRAQALTARWRAGWWCWTDRPGGGISAWGWGRSFVGLDGAGAPVTLSPDAPLGARQAVVVYDDQADAFTLLPGSSQELCYLAGEAVLTAQPLAGGEELKLGSQTLRFVPFCGGGFRW